MSNIAELFVLFPISETYDKPYPLYIKSYNQLNDDPRCHISNIVNLCEFISHENYNGYYDSFNIKAFLMPLDTLDDCYPSIITLLRKIFLQWDDWRESMFQIKDDKYYFLHTEIHDDTLCEIAKRSCMFPNNSILLINNNAINFHDETISLESEFNISEIHQCNCEIMELAKWFEINRKPKRYFNLNPKHGENGKGNFPSASPLLCSRMDASVMLNKAVGEKFNDKLFFYDNTHKKYIEFRYENTPKNTYHAYHIEEENVPKSILRKIKLLLD